MNCRRLSAVSWIETLVCLAVFSLLFLVAFANVRPRIGKGQMTQSLSNQKQLHLATQQMALDGTTTGDTNLGWPGDIGGTFEGWAKTLVQSNYLLTNDLRKLLSAPGRIVPTKGFPTAKESAVLVYAVREKSPGDTMFLSTANFTNTPTGGMPLQKDAVPYGDRGFVVFRKGGDGAILLPKQVGNTNLLGGYAPLCP